MEILTAATLIVIGMIKGLAIMAFGIAVAGMITGEINKRKINK